MFDCRQLHRERTRGQKGFFLVSSIIWILHGHFANTLSKIFAPKIKKTYQFEIPSSCTK